jgi:D-glycero-D-manno-heptose 1,7-bisphosphate phosphatase
VRLLVHEASLAGQGARMGTALAGLERRGHEIAWSGATKEEAGRVGRPGARDLPGTDMGGAEIVVGGGEAPFRVALAGRLAGARVMLLDLHLASLDRWGWLERWAWDSLFSVALVGDEDAGSLVADPRGLPRERIGLWPAGAPGSIPDPAHPDVEVLERACERALARHRGGVRRPAVFLDRDGTLVRETGYLSDPEALELLPGVGLALRNLVEAGIPLVVVSNQSGVGRGMFTSADVHAIMARLRQRLRAHGVEISAIYYCPHRPEEGCPCRKPRTGLLERAAEDLHLSLADSVMIGDKRIDAAAGRRAGGRGVLVRTGYGRDEEGRADAPGPAPDHVCDDLAAAVAWWLGPE